MLYVIAEQLGFPGILNLIRYISFRAGAGAATALLIGLLLGPASTPPLPMDRVVAHELELYGSHGMAAHEYPAMLELVADGTLRPDLLVGEVLPLEGAGAALAAMDHPPTKPGMTVISLPGRSG